MKYILPVIKEKKVAIVIALTAFILGYLMLRIFIFSEIKEAKNYQKRLKSINKKMENLEGMFIKHPDIDREIELLKERKDDLAAGFPQEREFLSLANQVISDIEDHGVRIKDFRYIYDLPELALEGLTRYGLELECTADFLNLAMFFENLERKQFKTGVYGLNITKIDDWNINVNMRIDFILSQER